MGRKKKNSYKQKKKIKKSVLPVCVNKRAPGCKYIQFRASELQWLGNFKSLPVRTFMVDFRWSFLGPVYMDGGGVP